MRKLPNGWHVPEGDTKMSRHIETDASPVLAEYEEKQRKTILKHIPVKNTFVDVGATNNPKASATPETLAIALRKVDFVIFMKIYS